MQVSLNSGTVEIADAPLFSRCQDLSGNRYGRIEVIGPVIDGNRTNWLCGCDCGKLFVCGGPSLYSKRKFSCGCYRRESAAAGIVERSTTHDMSHSPEYKTYRSMLSRCGVAKAYLDVEVCDRWRGEGGFEAFYADMGNRPSAEHSLDRIDPRGHYCPENCRWATREQQANNRRNTLRITALGKTLTVTEWAKETGLSGNCLRSRLYAGWSPEEIVTLPPDRRRRGERPPTPQP